MTFIAMQGIDDAREPDVMPEGEYDLVINDAKIRNTEGKNDIMVIIAIEGEPNAANVFHFVSLPSEDDDDDKVKVKMLFARRFFHQFSIDVDGGVDTEQFVGSRCRGKLTQEEFEDNLSNKLQVNRLPAEEADEEAD